MRKNNITDEEYALIRDKSGNEMAVLESYRQKSFPTYNVGPMEFVQLISNWIALMTFGTVPINVGVFKIVEFLDEKHNYKK